MRPLRTLVLLAMFGVMDAEVRAQADPFSYGSVSPHDCPIPGGKMGLRKPTVVPQCTWTLDEDRTRDNPDSDVDDTGGTLGPGSQHAWMAGMNTGINAWMRGWAYDTSPSVSPGPTDVSASLQLSAYKSVYWVGVGTEIPEVHLDIYGKATSHIEIVSTDADGYILSHSEFDCNILKDPCESLNILKGDDSASASSVATSGSSVTVGGYQLALPGSAGTGTGTYPGLGWLWPERHIECCIGVYSYTSKILMAGRVHANGYSIPLYPHPTYIAVPGEVKSEARIDIYGVALLKCDCPQENN